jgi:nitroreductase
MAICSSAAICVGGLSYDEDFFALPKGAVTEMPFHDLVKTRRSIRTFKEKPVPRALLEKIVEAISFAPPSFTPLKTEVVVVEDTAVIRQALPEMIKVYDSLLKAMSNPIGRFIIRRKNGVEKMNLLENHVVPMMKSRLPELKQGVEDTITRNAQAMILFHAHRDADKYETDINIAMTFGMLAAHALGLGGTLIDLIPPTIQNNDALRQLFKIPDDNIPVAALILGYPKYRYRRGIKRNLKRVTWITADS